MPIGKNELRTVMGHFATGVTIITTFTRRASCMASPPTRSPRSRWSRRCRIICVDKKAESYPSFEESKVFTVNILRGPGRAVAQVRGQRRRQVQRRRYKIGGNGAPILDDVIAWLECKVTAAIDGGDHTIYVGEIEEAQTRARASR